jgi:TonB family protein
MYFNFEDNHPDITPVGHAISWREGILLSIIFHLLAGITILVVPPLDSRAAEARIAQQIALQRQRERDSTRFVFVQPHLDMPAMRPPSPRAEASDKDRNVQSRERARDPKNAMPFSLGNTRERTEAFRSAPSPQPRAEVPPQPADPSPNGDAASPPPAPSSGSLVLPGPRAGNGRVPDAPAASGMGAGRGLLGSAMRDLQQMVQQGQFDNPEGGGDGKFGPSIQFDTKGVEFGPWIRRFIAQIKRNWNIPLVAMANNVKGHVVVTFYIQKDGTISQLMVPGPCNVDAFNRSAYNAMAASNPTYPLPPEYPSDRAFFTVTFYYNEIPPGGGS